MSSDGSTYCTRALKKVNVNHSFLFGKQPLTQLISASEYMGRHELRRKISYLKEVPKVSTHNTPTNNLLGELLTESQLEYNELPINVVHTFRNVA